MISEYNVEVDADGDGATVVGTVTILGHKHQVRICGSGRDITTELDGKEAPEELQEGLGEWTDPFDAIQPILSEIAAPYEIEDYSGRVVNGKVVSLIVRDGRELRVVRGTLVEDLS